MKAEIQKEWYSLKQCRDNPNKIYVFGDNLIGRGKKGQATIRDANNAVGIPTKRLPSMKSGSFFSDKVDELTAIKRSLLKLLNLKSDGYIIVFPAKGLGTGLSKMPTNSPKLFTYMNKMISETFDIDYFKE